MTGNACRSSNDGHGLNYYRPGLSVTKKWSRSIIFSDNQVSQNVDYGVMAGYVLFSGF